MKTYLFVGALLFLASVSMTACTLKLGAEKLNVDGKLSKSSQVEREVHASRNDRVLIRPVYA